MELDPGKDIGDSCDEGGGRTEGCYTVSDVVMGPHLLDLDFHLYLVYRRFSRTAFCVRIHGSGLCRDDREERGVEVD